MILSNVGLRESLAWILLVSCIAQYSSAFTLRPTLQCKSSNIAKAVKPTSAICLSATAPRLPKEFFDAKPSTPGWEGSELDKLTDWAVDDTPNRPIFQEWKPDVWWLLTRFKGTVLQLTVVPILVSMGYAFGVDQFIRFSAEPTWDLLALPPSDCAWLVQLSGLDKVWGYVLSFCTFVLGFFNSQAYSYRSSVYQTTRDIQGRIDDICMLLTMNAGRSAYNGDRKGDKESKFISKCTRLLRLSHTFFWAASPTNSDGLKDKAGDTIGPKLLSKEGLSALQEAGELTPTEAQSLLSSDLPPSQYAYILLNWAGSYLLEGISDKVIIASNSLQGNFLRLFTALSGDYSKIGDLEAGRMSMAYIQLMQVLINLLLLLAPFALYSALGSLSIPMTGLLTFFFYGLLELAKSFLDPFGNEGFAQQNIHVDVLVSELNFVAGTRWVNARKSLPPIEKD